MALCDACGQAFVFRFGPAYAEMHPIGSRSALALLGELDGATQNAEPKPLPEAVALFPSDPATGSQP